MITARFALVCIRLLLASMAVVYGLLKLTIAPDSAPLLGVNSDVAQQLLLPYETNPIFATTVIIVSITMASLLIFLSVRNWISEVKEFGHPAPFASPAVLALMTLFSLFAVYYLVVAVVAGAVWFYAATVASIAVILSVYEGKQYSDGHR